MKTTQNLTDKLVQSIKTDKPRIQITDGKTTGLKLRVSKSGHKSFALMVRNSAGKNETITIGTYPEISLKQARERALKIRLDIKTHGAFKPSVQCTNRKQTITLRALIGEAQTKFSETRKCWRPRGGPKSTPHARSTIERVFAPLLDRPVESLTAEDFGRVANSYTPMRALKGKTTANGQVSRSISYLAPVLDWAANRGRKFWKIGAGRPVKLDVAELRRISDPASDDPTIKGKRERVLSAEEIAAILPLLQYPTPKRIRREKILPEDDFGPIAMRFLLLTLARREEAANACWGDIDFVNGVWVKPEVKDTTGEERSQRLPLSKAAIDLLKSLPGYGNANKEAFIFPNRDGGKLDNWNRIAEQIQVGSGTSDWTRHDLRRTGSTLLHELKVPIETIEEILDHRDRFAKTAASGSAGHYIVATRILNDDEDPIITALNDLSKALDIIVMRTKPAADPA